VQAPSEIGHSERDDSGVANFVKAQLLGGRSCLEDAEARSKVWRIIGVPAIGRNRFLMNASETGLKHRLSKLRGW
jgi:hypothetical protein